MGERRNHRVVVTERGGPQVLQLVDEAVAHRQHHGGIVLIPGVGGVAPEGSAWT